MHFHLKKVNKMSSPHIYSGPHCYLDQIKRIGRFIRKVYKKHYWTFKLLLPQLSKATYAPEYCYSKLPGWESILGGRLEDNELKGSISPGSKSPGEGSIKLSKASRSYPITSEFLLGFLLLLFPELLLWPPFIGGGSGGCCWFWGCWGCCLFEREGPGSQNKCELSWLVEASDEFDDNNSGAEKYWKIHHNILTDVVFANFSSWVSV